MVTIKRAYEAPAETDGYRVLVDRLWPRGVKKEALALHVWAKELAPVPVWTISHFGRRHVPSPSSTAPGTSNTTTQS
jgi:uncharacterized protein YeaO (DUF488 family)